MKRSILLVVLTILTAIFTGCDTVSEETSGSSDVIFSDLETIQQEGGHPVFTTTKEAVFLKNADFVSSDYAFSGKQSIKLDSTHVYGLNYRMTNMKEGEFIRASIWQKKGGKDGTLIASVKGKDYTHKFRTYYNKKAKGNKGWVRHDLTFIVTKDVEHVDFFIFAGKTEAYFDDIEIVKYPSAPKNNLSKTLDLYIPELSKQELDGFISNALKAEIIPKSDKKYVRAFILNGEDSVKVKVKLKGDWTDHIKSGKTSYRVKVGGNNAYHGLKTFSIQHPKTRHYIHEWVIHQIADMEDVLSTKYDFVSVKINELDYGVYALEEHFDKQLLESRNRREGPIIKFDESGVWALNYAARKQGVGKGNFPYFDASVISMFKQNRTLETPGLKQGFEEAKVLLNLFKEGHLKIEDIFDIDLLARFYVLMELSASTHGLAWHNRRFYYNPVTQKLEHIVYDVIPYAITNKYRSIMKNNLEELEAVKELAFDNAIILSESFKSRYFYHLDRQTRPAYLDSVFGLIETELSDHILAIQSEEPFYEFSKSEYYANAEFLRKGMAELDSSWTAKMQEMQAASDWYRTETYFIRRDSFFVPEISLNVYSSPLNENEMELNIENYHLNSVSIEGYTDKTKPGVMHRFDQPVDLAPFLGKADNIKLNVPSTTNKLVFRADNYRDSLYEMKIIPWGKPGVHTSRMELESGFKASSDFYTISGNQIVLKKHIVIDELIYIPSYYQVRVQPGSIVEFKNGGGLTISNSFYAKGTSGSPIQFICRDSTSKGITILNGEEAVITHANFEGLSNLKYKRWELTGAVTIYETKATIQHVTISGNHSEDALNIIRSHFTIDDLIISETYSDGFDADFCTGTLTNSKFINTGNDCIDFSGSVIDISSIDIKNSGDKGVSGGEKSSLTLTDIHIDGAITGIASKDNSLVKGEGIIVNNTEVAYAAFQKKGEYAPANIELKSCETGETGKIVLVELGSEIILDEDVYEGTEKLDIDKLYERFEKK